MHLDNLQIYRFRNLKNVKIQFRTGLNLIYGNNGQGKTNILEAIYFLVTGRSFRTNEEREIIPWDDEEYEATLIRSILHNSKGESKLLISFNRKEKHIHINGSPLRRLGQLFGHLNAVLFTPDDLKLVRGTPAARRRFLDLALCQVSPVYLHALQSYNVALKQRNALLKRSKERPDINAELNIYDSQLAESGAVIAEFRGNMLNYFENSAQAHYSGISNQKEMLTLKYKPSLSVGKSEMETKEAFLKAFQNNHREDIFRQTTSVGPHRDDFHFFLDHHNAHDFASQGQQRSCVLALKMAEVDFITDKTSELPLLMLDDLMGELDHLRRDALLSGLNPNIQTIITTTDPFTAENEKLRFSTMFHVKDGQIYQ